MSDPQAARPAVSGLRRAAGSGLRRAAVRSILWTALESGSLSVLSFAVLIVLARLLTPDTFGTAALALGVVQVLASVVERVFHDAIVQRPAVTRREIASAHTVTVAAGVVVTAAVLALAPWAEGVFHAPGLAPVLAGMAPSILFTALAAVPLAERRREMDFRAVALRTLCGRLAGGGVGIGAAVGGYGVWSLVAQQNVTTLVASAAVLALGGRQCGRFASPRRAAGLLRFATTALAAEIMAANTAKLFLISCGFVLAPEGVGFLSLAMRMVDTVAAIVAGALSRVSLSLFSRLHQGGGALDAAYVMATRLASSLTAPLFLGLAATAPDVVTLLAGPGWDEAVPLVRVFAVAQLFRSFTYIGGAALTATGRPGANLVVQAVDLAAAELLLFTIGWHGLMWVGVAWALRLVAMTPVAMILLRRRCHLGAGAVVAGSVRAVLAAAVMAVLVVPLDTAPVAPALRLTAAVAMGVATYGAALWALDRRLYRDLRGFFARPAAAVEMTPVDAPPVV